MPLGLLFGRVGYLFTYPVYTCRKTFQTYIRHIVGMKTKIFNIVLTDISLVMQNRRTEEGGNPTNKNIIKFFVRLNGSCFNTLVPKYVGKPNYRRAIVLPQLVHFLIDSNNGVVGDTSLQQLILSHQVSVKLVVLETVSLICGAQSMSDLVSSVILKQIL